MSFLKLLLISIFGGLTTCRDCGNPVSYEASFCPGCGAPKPGKRWWIPLFVLLLILFVISVYFIYLHFQQLGSPLAKVVD